MVDDPAYDDAALWGQPFASDSTNNPVNKEN